MTRDYFRELGVKPFINAAGTYTALTSSLMPAEVREAWQYATSHYVRLTKLQDAVGARIAELTGAEAAMVTSGAAGALTVGTAGILTGTDAEKIRRLPDTTGNVHQHHSEIDFASLTTTPYAAPVRRWWRWSRLPTSSAP
ncbi:MAG: hypothetical protein U5J83_15800 [Bryobacterales bacterium]|nr:hypothetical protein [Bryobacterales bacterium]